MRKEGIPDDVEIETRIAQQEMEAEELIASVEKLGRVSRLTCPDCHGAQEVRRAIDTCFHEHTTMTLPEIELDQSSEGSGRYVSLRTAVRES